MVNQPMSPVEQLLGRRLMGNPTLTPGANAPGAGGSTPAPAGIPPAVQTALLGDQSAGSGAAAPPTGPPVPPSPTDPTQATLAPPGTGPGPSPTAGAPLPNNDGDLRLAFYAQHGREPTPLDLSAIHAIPAMEQALGRAPMRIEVLQWLGARNETMDSSPLQFAPDTPPSTAVQAAPAAGAPGSAPPDVPPVSADMQPPMPDPSAGVGAGAGGGLGVPLG